MVEILLQAQFYKIFISVLSIIFRIFIDICKIYELPKIYNKIPKTQSSTCLNDNNNNLTGQFSAKSVLFLLHQMFSLMSTVNRGDYYLSMRLFKFETNEKVQAKAFTSTCKLENLNIVIDGPSIQRLLKMKKFE